MIPWRDVTPGYWWVIRNDDPDEFIVCVLSRREIVLPDGRIYTSEKAILDWDGSDFDHQHDEYIFLAPVAPRETVDSR